MDTHSVLLKRGFLDGLHKGWHGFLWMMKILLPVSLFTALVEWSGLLQRMEFLIHPIMKLLGLPAMAAVPLLIGMLTSIYGGIAAMVVLPLTREQMTLIAVFLLISHNLIQEGVIQGKSGIHPIKATLIRLLAATVTVMAVAPFLGSPTADFAEPNLITANAKPLLAMLEHWAATTPRLILKVFLIIMAILTLLEVLRSMGWMHHIVRATAPLLVPLGLSRRVGILWMTAVVFGLAYGAAVILEEARKGDLTREELESLHFSIGINHSLVEDPALFMSLGLGAFWLWVPRLITAMLTVRLLTLYQRYRKRYGNDPRRTRAEQLRTILRPPIQRKN